MAEATILGLHIYPVKSLGGISLSESAVERRGLLHDRRWILADGEGMFMTQRSSPRLALFRTAIDADGLRIISPSGQVLSVPLAAAGPGRSVRVWKDEIEGLLVSEEVDAWLTRELGTNCSLLYMDDDTIRPTNPEFTQPGDIVGFADAYPILVISEASLAALNARLDEPLPMNRFRPNIVLAGCLPHAEDECSRLRMGDLTLRAAKQCARCAVTTTDQATAEVGVEPLRTLAKYRLRDQKIYFGAYFVPEQAGVLTVGQPVCLEFR